MQNFHIFVVFAVIVFFYIYYVNLTEPLSFAAAVPQKYANFM